MPNENKGTGRVYGKSLFAMVNGKMVTVGTILTNAAEIAPLSLRIDGVEVQFSAMKRSN